jgi:adenine phosphoribosyltransferase
MTKNRKFDFLKKYIRDIPDFPKKGIIFKDITTLLKESKPFKKVIDILYKRYRSKKIDKVVAIESRGFIFGGALATKLGAGFIPVRKKGKLPAATHSVTYDLEYGTDTLEMHRDAIEKGEKVLLIDDLLATGGTASSVCSLVEDVGGEIVELAFLIELDFLHGRDRLKGYKVFSMINY